MNEPQWEQLSLWKDESFLQDTSELRPDFLIALRWAVRLGIAEDAGVLLMQKQTPSLLPRGRESLPLGVHSMLHIPLATIALRLSSMLGSGASYTKLTTESRQGDLYSSTQEFRS